MSCFCRAMCNQFNWVKWVNCTPDLTFRFVHFTQCILHTIGKTYYQKWSNKIVVLKKMWRSWSKPAETYKLASLMCSIRYSNQISLGRDEDRLLISLQVVLTQVFRESHFKKYYFLSWCQDIYFLRLFLMSFSLWLPIFYFHVAG